MPRAMTYTLTDHVCMACLGRVLRQADGDTHVYRCSNCGAEAHGEVKHLCCCGVKLRTGRDAGIRCTRATERTPEFPGEIVALQVDGSLSK